MPPGLSEETQEDMRRVVENTEKTIARIYDREVSFFFSSNGMPSLSSRS